jgi:predicted dehydrogenase
MIARIAVIGAGTFGEMHLRAFTQMEREGRARLVGVADIDAELVATRRSQYGVATFLDYREMIEKTNPDGVAIATPDFLHREMAVYCLNAGKHVLVEKPLDVTVEGCLEMITAAEANGRLLQVDFHKRYDPYNRELRDMIARGVLGEIHYGYVHMEDRIEVPRDWFPEWAARSSPVWFLGVHMYDLIRWITGSDGKFVCATGIKRKLLSLGVNTYDSVQAKLLLSSGASFVVDTSWILPDGHEAVVNQGLRVVGSEGMMEIDTQDRGARGCLTEPTDGRAQKGPGMQTLNVGFFKEGKDQKGRAQYSGYGIDSIQDFALNVNYLLEGGSLTDLEGTYASGHDGLEATKIAVAAHKSVAAGGAVIPVDEFVEDTPHAPRKAVFEAP